MNDKAKDEPFYTVETLGNRLGISPLAAKELIMETRSLRAALYLEKHPTRPSPRLEIIDRDTGNQLKHDLYDSHFSELCGDINQPCAADKWVYLDLPPRGIVASTERPQDNEFAIFVGEAAHDDTERFGPIGFQDAGGKCLKITFNALPDDAPYPNGDLYHSVSEFWINNDVELVVPLEEVQRYECSQEEEVSERERETLQAAIGLLAAGLASKIGPGALNGSKVNAQKLAEVLLKPYTEDISGLSKESLRKVIGAGLKSIEDRLPEGELAKQIKAKTAPSKGKKRVTKTP